MAIYLRGAGSAPGVALGRAVRYLPDSQTWPTIDSNIESALKRFVAAQATAAGQLRALAEMLRAEGRLEEARIFDAHSLLVEDETLAQGVARRMRDEHLTVEHALLAEVVDLREAIEAIEDPYLRDRKNDIDSVRRAILAVLRGESTRRVRDLPTGVILVTNDLTPAETVSLRDGHIAGFATAEGGPTSHTTILARAFGIPAVVGLGAATLAVSDGASLVLDGDSSLLIVDPDTVEWTTYERRVTYQATIRTQRHVMRDRPGRLASGETVTVWANISHPDEARTALEQGAEGIGLFRTEFAFLERNHPPTEEEQYWIYCDTIKTMDGRPVIVRTLDIGGDKQIGYLHLPHETNPSLGLRGLRTSIHAPEIFQRQIRALLRAAVHGDIRILLPMIATVDDLLWAHSRIREASASLTQEGTPHRVDVPVGVMIETPAAAVTADLLARHASFFSIGSNDLAQYALAVDRGNATLSARYPHDSQAVLRLIAYAANSAIHAHLPVCICGELGAIPEMSSILVGMGVSQFSVNPASIPGIKERLQEITLAQAQTAARRILELHD